MKQRKRAQRGPGRPVTDPVEGKRFPVTFRMTGAERAYCERVGGSAIKGLRLLLRRAMDQGTA